MPGPQLWIVAGPNGAGKTTCVQKAPISQIIRGVEFRNPDDITLQRLISLGYDNFREAPQEVLQREFIAAAEHTYTWLEERISHNGLIGVETVLSTDKYRRLVEFTIEAGGIVRIIYVAVKSPQIAQRRVASRVSQGGHDVPPHKIEERWTRSLEQLVWFLQRADSFWILDNSDSQPHGPVEMIGEGQDGRATFISQHCFPEMRRVLEQL